MIDATLRLTKTMHHAMNRVQCSRTVSNEYEATAPRWSICMQNSFSLYFLYLILVGIRIAFERYKNTRGGSGPTWCIWIIDMHSICMHFALVIYRFCAKRETAFACKRLREYAWEQIFSFANKIWVFPALNSLQRKQQQTETGQNKKNRVETVTCRVLEFRTHPSAVLHWKSTIWVLFFRFFVSLGSVFSGLQYFANKRTPFNAIELMSVNIRYGIDFQFHLNQLIIYFTYELWQHKLNGTCDCVRRAVDKVRRCIFDASIHAADIINWCCEYINDLQITNMRRICSPIGRWFAWQSEIGTSI